MIEHRRILALSPFVQWPLVNGTIVRTWYFVNYLARTNDVWFGSRGGGEDTPAAAAWPVYNSAGRFAQLFSLRFLAKLWRLIRQEEIDLIVVIQLWSALHGLILKALTGHPLIFDNHNVEYRRWRRMGSPLWPFVAILELVACHGANQVICVSEEDRRVLAETLRVPPDKLEVINNGVDVDRFYRAQVDVETVRSDLEIGMDEQEILFFGPLSHLANAQAVDVILDQLVPRLRKFPYPWKVVIAGAGADPYLERRKGPLPENVLFTGFVDDIVALIKSADVIIVPLTAGSGTRYKILEGIACGRVVISTTIGAEGLDRQVIGDGLIIEDEWERFARAIAQRWNCPRELDLSPAFVEVYDWENIFARANLHV